MILEGWKKIIMAFSGLVGILILALAGLIPGEWAASAVVAIAVGHNAWQSLVDKGRPAPVKPEPKGGRTSKETIEILKSLADRFERKD